MPTPLDEVCAATLPSESLSSFGELRARRDLLVLVRAERAWAFWPAGDADVTRAVLALTGAQLFARREGLWYRLGQHLPAFDVPAPDEARPIANVLFPAPLQPEGPPQRISDKVGARLVRDDRPRPATALRCVLAELGRWADSATSYQLAGLQAAVRGGQALVRGARLPALAAAERFWGQTVLVPLGFRAEPALGEAVLSAALGLAAGEVAIWGAEGAEVVAGSAFAPVTRAGVRLALREGTP
jgi:hypothetical protein